LRRFSTANIPQELRNTNNWVIWKKEKRNGKFTKVPYDAKNGAFAKSNDPTTWTTFDAASQKAAFDAKYDGVGFMLYGTDFIGVDFDGCVDDGVPEPYVLNIISQMGKPYCEITPSCTGMRVFLRGSKLPPGNRKFNAKKKGVEKYGCEIYSGDEGGRYLTVTGDRYSGEGIPQISNIDLVYFLISKFPDEHFRRLWMGDSSEYENDDSRVDLALLGLFARAFNGDKEKMLRFFNNSVPGQREKWVERKDYRDLTIRKALEGITMSSKSWKEFVDQPRKIIEFQVHPDEEQKGKWTSFDYVIRPIEGNGTFDGWFPLGNPSLVGGSSGSGKTTFMLDLCVTQQMGRPFYGHGTLGRPYLVLMMDRGKEAHERTMRRLGFSPEQVPIKFLKAAVDGEASQQIIEMVEQTIPMPELVFIEGMDMLVSDPNSLEIVMPFMHEIQQIATHFHIAIVGSVGAPKTKPKDGYAAKRDTIFGSAVWSRMSETIVTLQFPNGDDTAERRVISVLPRNAKAERFEAGFQRGKLIELPSSETGDRQSTMTAKEREEKDAAYRAEMFIQDFLQEDRSKWGAEVIEAAKLHEGIGKNAIQDAAARLYKQGILRYSRNSKHQSIWTLAEVKTPNTVNIEKTFFSEEA
jgi:AAA domain